MILELLLQKGECFSSLKRKQFLWSCWRPNISVYPEHRRVNLVGSVSHKIIGSVYQEANGNTTCIWWATKVTEKYCVLTHLFSCLNFIPPMQGMKDLGGYMVGGTGGCLERAWFGIFFYF